MNWSQVSPEQRDAVLRFLDGEADRLEQDAARLEGAARGLGRPSLTEDHFARAAAFRAAIAMLERP